MTDTPECTLRISFSNGRLTVIADGSGGAATSPVVGVSFPPEAPPEAPASLPPHATDYRLAQALRTWVAVVRSHGGPQRERGPEVDVYNAAVRAGY